METVTLKLESYTALVKAEKDAKKKAEEAIELRKQTMTVLFKFILKMKGKNKSEVDSFKIMNDAMTEAGYKITYESKAGVFIIGRGITELTFQK